MDPDQKVQLDPDRYPNPIIHLFCFLASESGSGFIMDPDPEVQLDPDMYQDPDPKPW